MTKSQSEENLRRKYPKMFSHPESLQDEIFIGDQIVDFVDVNIQIYRTSGLASARKGNSFIGINGFTFYPVFANLDQYLELEKNTEY